MKAIYLSDQPNRLLTVYDEKSRTRLQSVLQIGDKIYSKEDVINGENELSDVEIAFSTWGMPIVTEEEIRAHFPNLNCLFYAAGSVQGFARPFLSCGVKVFSAWAANAVPVAEMTVAQIVLANKGYFLTSRLYREHGNKMAMDAFKKCRGNYGETVGIIGAGMIGKLVIEMLKAYNLNVLVFDPFLSDEKADELGIKKCSLDELFESSFVVSNHLANNSQTQGILNYALFSKMRENAVFINTGRGAQVIEDDLVRVLRERPDLTALLDVTHPEPPAKDHPFYTLENCLLTPHIAGSAGDEVARMGSYMVRECESYLAGENCAYEVTAKMLETMA